MGNRCSGFMQALTTTGRKLRMLNGHLERYNTQVCELEDILNALNNQERAQVFRIRKEITALRLRVPKAQLSKHVEQGTAVYQMVTELADIKKRLRSNQMHLQRAKHDRQAINSLIQHAERENSMELAEDLKRFGLTLDAVSVSNEEAHLASATLGDLASAATPIAVPENVDVGSLLASLLSEEQAAVPIYANGNNDVVNAVAELASGRMPLEPGRDDADDDNDASASVVFASDQRPSRQQTVVELGD